MFTPGARGSARGDHFAFEVTVSVGGLLLSDSAELEGIAVGQVENTVEAVG